MKDLLKNMSIEEKMQLYNDLAEDIIGYANTTDSDTYLRCINTKLVKTSMLYANNYNPNKMPSIEMNLLKRCIKKYGFLFPIITTYDAEKNMYRIIDGEHRYTDFIKAKRQYVAIIDLQIPLEEAKKLTVLMNRIKGIHKVESMAELIIDLYNSGCSAKEIATDLGMEIEEYRRLCEQIGVPLYFSKHEYSKSWEVHQ